MTIALCLNCGDTKVGALCPCRRCGQGSSGDPSLDILFSDHRMTVETLERFGEVIKQIAGQGDEPNVRFWAFILYMSEHPSDLMQATAPPEIADRAAALLTEVQPPIVQADLKEIKNDDGPPQQPVDVPEPLLTAYLRTNPLGVIQSIQVRLRDGTIRGGSIYKWSGELHVVVTADQPISSDQVVAVRRAPGCLTGWIIRPRWIEA